MGCTIAMAVLGLCHFTLANEPVAQDVQKNDNQSPALVFQDHRARGEPDATTWLAAPSQPRRPSQRIPRRGVVTVRTRG